VPVSAQQIDIFARLYPMNARPVQALAGRLIKQSN
jgi:carbonic anhydrase